MLTDLRWLVLAAAAAPLAFYAAAIACAWFFFRQRHDSMPDFYPPVSILKPLRGLNRETYENLASFCRLDYPEYELLFCIDHPHDPALPVIRKLQADFPRLAIGLSIGASVSGSNNKVSKLCRLATQARYELLVASDADTRVEPDYLRRVALPFRDSRVGVVTCLYRGLAGPGLWSELEDLSLTSDFLAGVLVARKLGVKFALGATMAVRRQALAKIGGFETLADVAADDHELGRRVADCGYRVEFAYSTVETECSARCFVDLFRQRLRWAVVTRASRPWGHLGLLFAQGLPWAIAAAALAPSQSIAIAYGAGYVALRLAVAFTVGVWGLRDPLPGKKWWLLPINDSLGFVVWLASLVWRRVSWQGSAYRVHKGRLIPIASKGFRAKPQGASSADAAPVNGS